MTRSGIAILTFFKYSSFCLLQGRGSTEIAEQLPREFQKGKGIIKESPSLKVKFSSRKEMRGYK